LISYKIDKSNKSDKNDKNGYNKNGYNMNKNFEQKLLSAAKKVQ